MFGQTFNIARVYGFDIKADVSWIFLALLVTWSLAAGFFPAVLPGYTSSTYWSMAVVGAIGLFFSLIFHELSHSLVARRYDMPIRGITLFLFGGVAEMQEEPRDPRSEFLIAIAGPIASLVLALAFYLISLALGLVAAPGPVAEVPRYLAIVNLLLAGFNMLPAFPLDGGRALRAFLWHRRGDLLWATRIATNMGRGFGFLLMALGILNLVGGNFIGGMWWFLIGLFVQGSAAAAYRRLTDRMALKGRSARDLMTPDPVTVTPELSLTELTEDFVYRYHHPVFPVVRDGRLLGAVSTEEIKQVPRDAWERTTVGAVLVRVSDENTVSADADADDVFARIQATRRSRLMVTEKDRLVGIIALKDMLDFLSLKRELES